MIINVGLVGAGSIGRKYATYCHEDYGVKLTAVTALDEKDDWAQVAVEDGPMFYSNYRDMLECAEVDAVVVSTIDRLSASASTDALRRGKHVLCHFPLSISLNNARKIMMAARFSGKIFMAGLCHRFHDAIRRWKYRIDDRRIGPLRSIGISGMGLSTNSRAVWLDVARYFLGAPTPRKVTPSTVRRCCDHRLAATLSFTDTPISLDVDVYGHCAACTASSFKKRGGLALQVKGKDGEMTLTEAELMNGEKASDPMGEMMAHFAHGCHIGGRLVPSGEDVYDVICILDGLKRAWAERRTMSF